MKLDLFKKQWLDVVFEGRNKSYGAYDLRTKSPKTTAIALLCGAALFSFAVAAPGLLGDLFDGLAKEDDTIDQKITTVKLPPKEKPKEALPPPPPPPPPVQDQVKFVKPEVAKAEEVTENPPKIEEIKNKQTGAETIKGDPDAPITIEAPGNGDTKVVEAEPEILYNSAGIEVKPDFPGGIEKFYKFVGNNFQVPDEEGLKGKVYVSFVVEKDGSLTDIKVLRDIGFGTGAEAIRVLKKCPKWAPGEQNGKKVRCTYQLPISIQAPE
ncbi:energy transducer TonB [Flavobacterium branchiophilum]|uniref:Energy transducer TonB n=1 Tax=Flavobacterium branchiophilum TaxID=55197 RepID=A0A2H3KLT0_9FLAO|nr:energy transducer TonB [Flavobacterium branchiophilum]OXA74451.1 energy transducer TonB [Flavobacterium branchiophilum] [Flavobacterium branchiophilum NBRC 15030 = ATCC 35035]PDS24188.1 energy transducer TonB [Flavobacterium branchiophilum]TQM41057.1 outer membrane transport energization protein TonB [Flavobacterium branchiophilum]GEM54663.1 biopolymer transporter TonB [Flavobacterium branchiophilum NBRC 15030 = ATCC 35035]